MMFKPKVEQHFENILNATRKIRRNGYELTWRNSTAFDEERLAKVLMELRHDAEDILKSIAAIEKEIESPISLPEIIATFPSEFGLAAFPGGRFRISPTSSYMSEGRPVLYTEIRKGDKWLSFAKGTPDELRRELVTIFQRRSTV